MLEADSAWSDKLSIWAGLASFWFRFAQGGPIRSTAMDQKQHRGCCRYREQQQQQQQQHQQGWSNVKVEHGTQSRIAASTHRHVTPRTTSQAIILTPSLPSTPTS